MHALLSTELGSQCCPGGKEEGGGRWEDTVHHQTRGTKGHQENQGHPPHCFTSLCKMGPAHGLPLCWGQEIREGTGGFPWQEGREDGFASPCPFPLCRQLSCRGMELACVYTPCPEKPGRLSGSSLGSCGDPSRGVLSLSSSCSPASTPAREGNHRGISCTLPSGLLPPEKCRLSAGVLDARGRRPKGRS